MEEEKKGTDFYVPVVVAITLRTTSKMGAVIQTQIVRAPMKGEPEGFFAEVDKTLKDHASNHMVELGKVIPVAGLYLHLVSVPKEKQTAVPTPEPEKKD